MDKWLRGSNQRALEPYGIIRGSALWVLCRYRHNTHWTGHHSRLYREIENPFGSPEYAFEELIAELGGSFLCAHVGMPYNGQHADYIKSWIQVLQNDHRAIFKAAHQAQKALDFITKAQFEDQNQEDAA